MNFKKMSRLLGIFFLFTALVLGCSKGEKTAQTQEPQAAVNKPLVERSSTVTLNATIEGVDYEGRTFTLKDEAGNTQVFKVQNPDVPLEKLKAGMPVQMTIFQKDLYYVAAAGTEIPVDEEMAEVKSTEGEEGQKISVTKTQTWTNTVQAVDLEKRIITLAGEDGSPFELEVQQDVTNLDKLKPGDKIVTKSIQVVSVSFK